MADNKLMDDKPRNLRTLLADAKDTSELMVDLAYAAVYFGDPEMADEVRDLESEMTELVADMRSLAVLAVRHPREAPGMGRVLQVISAIERIGNDAVNIARTVSNQLGIPAHLVEELSDAEEVTHRVVVGDGSTLAHRALIDLEIPVHTGMRVLALRGSAGWTTTVSGATILVPGDVLFMEGPPGGIPTKNVSEAAVGLAYSAHVLNDRGLAAEVRHLETRLDEMHDQLETWVLRAAASHSEPSPLRGLLHLAAASEDIGDQASAMVMFVEHGEEVHPVLGVALSDTDEVVLRVPVASGCEAEGALLADLQLDVFWPSNEAPSTAIVLGAMTA